MRTSLANGKGSHLQHLLEACTRRHVQLVLLTAGQVKLYKPSKLGHKFQHSLVAAGQGALLQALKPLTAPAQLNIGQKPNRGPVSLAKMAELQIQRRGSGRHR